MGRRGQRNAAAGASKKQGGTDPVLAAALAAGGGGPGCRPMPPKKRQELNSLVEKLLALCSNVGEAPSTPQALMQEHMQIRSLVEQVREAESGNNMNRPIVGPRGAHASALRQWVEELGGEVSKGLRVRDCPEEGGLGLEAAEDLKQGEVVLRVPRRAMMSVDTARDSEIGRLIERDPMLQAMGNVSLALHLLLEKTSPASFWEPYINSLPQSYTTVLYFSSDDLAELRGSPALEDALKQYKYVARQYAYFYRKFEGTMLKDYFTFDEYRWAVSTVMTRQNQVPSSYQEGKFVNALIPFWDLSNHRADEGMQLSTDYEEEEEEEEQKGEEKEEGERKRGPAGAGGKLKCMAGKDFKKGEQFSIYYGERGNHDLLIHNGFVPRGGENPDNFLQLRLGVGKNDPLANAKSGILGRLGLSNQGHFALRKNRKSPYKLDPLLVAFVRVLCLKSEEEAKEWGEGEEGEKTRKLLDEETTEELDKRAYLYLLTRCHLLLRSYPTTLEADAATKREDLSQIRSFCLDLRMGEKEILGDVVELCKKKTEGK